MGKTYFHLLCIFTLFIFAFAKECSSQTRILQEDKTIQVLKGETVILETGALDKNTTSVNYELTGDVLQFVNKVTESPEAGYKYFFKATNFGEAAITLNIGNNGKDNNENILKRFYKVKVINDSELIKVNVVDIYNNPKKFSDGLYIIEGTSRGWGNPVNATVVWGNMVTRSDWVLEDATGALFITGIFKVESGTAIKVFGKTVLNSNNEWAFYGYKVINQ